MTQLRMDWRWLDRITHISDDETRVEARRLLQPHEWYFEHHFRGFPVLPGVLLIEAMAHTAGMLRTARAWRRERKIRDHVIAHVEDARFYRFARPGDEVVLTGVVDEEDDSGRVVARTRAAVGNMNVARARLVLHQVDPANEDFPGSSDGTADAIGAYAYLDLLLPNSLRERYGMTRRDHRNETTADGSV